MPNARTVWLYLNELTNTDVIDSLFQKCGELISEKGYLAMGSWIDHIGCKLLYPALPTCASCLTGDKGYDSDEFRAALKAKRPNYLVGNSKTPFKQIHKVENT